MILPRLKYFINEKQSAITVIFLIVTIATYTFLYFTHPSLPNDAPSGWWGWFDQGQYIKSVKALSQANLSPSEHWYFPGYPLLGAILYKYMPVHPFFLSMAFVSSSQHFASSEFPTTLVSRSLPLLWFLHSAPHSVPSLTVLSSSSSSSP
jgi:hypothetical protein